MFGKKHKMTVTVEIPYEMEVADNVSDIDETCNKRVSTILLEYICSSGAYVQIFIVCSHSICSCCDFVVDNLVSRTSTSRPGKFFLDTNAKIEGFQGFV